MSAARTRDVRSTPVSTARLDYIHTSTVFVRTGMYICGGGRVGDRTRRGVSGSGGGEGGGGEKGLLDLIPNGTDPDHGPL